MYICRYIYTIFTLHVSHLLYMQGARRPAPSSCSSWSCRPSSEKGVLDSRRAKMAHIRQSSPDAGRDFKSANPLKLFPPRSEIGRPAPSSCSSWSCRPAFKIACQILNIFIYILIHIIRYIDRYAWILYCMSAYERRSSASAIILFIVKLST